MMHHAVQPSPSQQPQQQSQSPGPAASPLLYGRPEGPDLLLLDNNNSAASKMYSVPTAQQQVYAEYGLMFQPQVQCTAADPLLF
ncbi:hypothetical protein R5R35_014676 [Gryllus longicercus]|uniref:Uncharacterized protein n=1 Tax=Gryllus longicercus TaxID=2509291 RepID=A0AAN9VQK4_9ORTH